MQLRVNQREKVNDKDWVSISAPTRRSEHKFIKEVQIAGYTPRAQKEGPNSNV